MGQVVCAYSDGLALATAATRNLSEFIMHSTVERGDGLSRGLYRWAALGYKHSEGESLLLVFVLIGYSLKLGSSGKALLPL